MAPTTRRQARQQQANEQQEVSTPQTTTPPSRGSSGRRTPGLSNRTQPRRNSPQTPTTATTAATPADNSSAALLSRDRSASVDIDLTRSRSATPAAPRLAQTITIDLTDSSPEPEETTNPLIHNTSRLTRPPVRRGRPPVTPRSNSNPIAVDPHVTTPGFSSSSTSSSSAAKRPRLASAFDGSGLWSAAESQVEDDEEFPIIKELEEARKERLAEANAAATQAGITCPICFDDSVTVTKEGRQMMSTTCGHVFCSSCIKGLFVSGGKNAECPKCRKKISPKSIHPIFI